jgi:HPt (histidine-containing phosphotransfer) domain-containing protein
MVEIMKAETPDELSRLTDHLTDENWEGVRALSHKLKSTAQFLGLREIHEELRQMEVNAKERRDLNRMPETLDKISLALNSAIGSLNEIENS